MKAFRTFLAFLMVVATGANAAVINGELKSAMLENLSSDPSSTVSGRVYYNTTTNGAKIYNGTAWTGMGGAGAGEKNYIVNGSSSATGWTASGAGLATPATDSTAADLPEPTVATALKLTGASGSSAYAFYPFTLDPSDYSRKLKVSFAQACGLVGSLTAIANCAASDFKVDVYSCTVAWSGSPATTCSGTSTRLALSTDSAAVSALPALTGTYRTTFDSPNATAPYLQLRVGMNTTQTHAIALSSIVVGPGVVTQGAAVSDWTSYTPIFVGLGTVSGAVFSYQRIGSSMLVTGFVTAGTTSGSTASITLPNSLTVNTGAIGGAGIPVGRWWRGNASATTRKTGTIISVTNANTLQFGSDDQSAASSPYSAVAGNGLFSTSDNIVITFEAPINEWAGNGTVNIAANTPAFVSTSGTWDLDSSTTVNGQAGQPIGGALTTVRFKTVTLPGTPQSGDLVQVEVDPAGTGQWVPMIGASSTTNNSGVMPLTYTTSGIGGNSVGIQLQRTGATTYVVAFGHYYSASLDGSTVLQSWADWSATSARWRLAWYNGNQAVGFGAATATQNGLISAEDSGTFTLSFTGARTVSPTATYVRNGKMVSWYITSSTGSSCTASFFSSGATDVPAALRPVNTTRFPFQVQNNGAVTNGEMQVSSAGQVVIWTSSEGNFTNAANCGWLTGQITYTIN